MASEKIVERVLGAFQRNHNKPPAWARESLRAWAGALRGYRDADVTRTCSEMLRARADSPPPTVATFIGRLEASPLSYRKAGPEGCEACGCTGWREIAVWREAGGHLTVTCYAGACDCPKGIRYSLGDAQGWRAAVERFRDDPYVSHVYHTTEAEPALPMVQRMHPDVVARIGTNRHSPPPDAGGAWATLVEPSPE